MILNINLFLHLVFQGSRDNISAVLVALPAAPKVTDEAIEQVGLESIYSCIIWLFHVTSFSSYCYGNYYLLGLILLDY